MVYVASLYNIPAKQLRKEWGNFSSNAQAIDLAISNALANLHPVIIYIKGSGLSVGHAVVARGYETMSKEIMIYDPLRKNNYYKLSQYLTGDRYISSITYRVY